MKRILFVIISLSLSAVSSAATYSQTVNVGHKIWLQPTLSKVADSIDGGGWIKASNDDVYGMFKSYFGGGQFQYTGEPYYGYTSMVEAFGSIYFSGADLQFFDDFEPQYKNERYYSGSGIFDYYLYAQTTSTMASVMYDDYYEVAMIGDYANSQNLSWQYKVNPVPIPAAAFLFAPALLGFMGLRRKAKNTIA